MEFHLQAEKAMRGVPGVTAVASSDSVPPGGWQAKLRDSDVTVKGRPPTPPGFGGWVPWRHVTPEYFRALDIPVICGRGFTDEDSMGDVPLNKRALNPHKTAFNVPQKSCIYRILFSLQARTAISSPPHV
jgi:hypothetical protein